MCLYNGITPTVKTAIQFVHPVYLWVLVIGSSYSVIITQLEFQTEIAETYHQLNNGFTEFCISACKDLTVVFYNCVNDIKSTFYIDDGVYGQLNQEYCLMCYMYIEYCRAPLVRHELNLASCNTLIVTFVH